jgi:hypothetical protein
MSKSVFGIATTQGQAERIVQQLQAEGFATSEISVLMPDTGGTRDIGHVKATKAPEGATTGAATGGATGGVLGLPWQELARWPFRGSVHLLRRVQLWGRLVARPSEQRPAVSWAV